MRLIDADALRAKAFVDIESGEPFIGLQELDEAPTIDAAPVVHGRWEWDTEDVYRCSNCYEKSHVKEVMEKPVWEYCPNCGAKMDGDSHG